MAAERADCDSHAGATTNERLSRGSAASRSFRKLGPNLSASFRKARTAPRSSQPSSFSSEYRVDGDGGMGVDPGGWAVCVWGGGDGEWRVEVFVEGT